VRVEGRFVLNGAEGATAAAVAGLGIVSNGAFGMLKELESGLLVRVLPDWEMGTAEAHVILAAGRAAKPSARAFSDFAYSQFRELEAAWDRIERLAPIPAMSLTVDDFAAVRVDS
jgi:DNA-binding transcriptional LysR family regulator